MPMLRWLGRSARHVLPVDADRARRSASRSRRPCATSSSCRSRSGPRKEMNSPRSTARSKLLHHGAGPKDFCRSFDLEKRHSLSSARRQRRPAWRRAAAEELDQPHAGPGHDEGDDGERRRLVGAVGADQLQIGAEGRPVEQARHGELADDDGEGEEGAAQHGDADVREDHAEEDRRTSSRRGFRAASVRVRTSIARKPVSTARYM